MKYANKDEIREEIKAKTYELFEFFKEHKGFSPIRLFKEDLPFAFKHSIQVFLNAFGRSYHNTKKGYKIIGFHLDYDYDKDMTLIYVTAEYYKDNYRYTVEDVSDKMDIPLTSDDIQNELDLYFKFDMDEEEC